MIDVEQDLYAQVSAALQAALEGVALSNEPVKKPAAFPAAVFYEQDNRTYDEADTTDGTCHVTYEATVYAENTADRKNVCRTGIQAVDGVMRTLGFARTACGPQLDPEDPTYLAITARYEAVIDKNLIIYRR